MYPRCLLAMLVGAALTGCAGEHQNMDEDWDRPTKPIEAAVSDDASEDVDVEPAVLSEDERCEPMAEEGACALVCDPDALLERYVPEGTCIHFVCPTADGERHHMGACR